MKKIDYTDRNNIILLACICCFLWGSAYPSIKIGYKLFNIDAFNIYGKFIFAGYRFFIAGLIVLLFEIINKRNIFVLKKKEILQVSILGILQTTLQYIFFYIGLSNTTGVRGSILNGTGTFFCIILAHIFYKNDKININKIIGCIIGFLGVILINLNGNIADDKEFSFIGEGFIIISAFAASISYIYSKRITKKISPSLATGYQLLIGGIILIILGFLNGGKLHGFTLKSTILLIYMALISSIAFVIWTQLLKYNKVSKISIFNFLIPVFGTILSAVFLKENIFDIKILLALFLVSLGIYFAYKDKKNCHNINI